MLLDSVSLYKSDVHSLLVAMCLGKEDGLPRRTSSIILIYFPSFLPAIESSHFNKKCLANILLERKGGGGGGH